MEQSNVTDVEIVIEKIQEIEPHDKIGEVVPEIIIANFESEKVKVIITEPDVLQIQEEINIKETFANAITKNKIQGYEIDSTEEVNIYDANTQMPSNRGNYTIDEEERPLSMEVDYDFTGKENVPVIEKLEDENLPSTNETDDIQITCGQVAKNSQEVEGRKCVGENVETCKVNGINLPKNGFPNGDIPEGNTEITSKVPRNTELTVEDMLADFVDEVEEEAQVTQA